MLMSKLSAPPIANCLGTLKMFFNRIRQHRIQCDASWYSLVVNFADQDYLQGVQQGDTSLGQAISTIINSLSYSFNKQLLLIPYKCSKSLTQICNKISMKIWSPTKQWKYTGVAITIIRTLNEKLQRLSALLSTYLLAQFIRNIATFSQLSNLEYNKNLVSQLGVFLTIKFQAIRVHNQGVSNIESQSVILLFLIKVYQSNEGFLKVVVLKCLMQMQKNQKMKRMVIKIHNKIQFSRVLKCQRIKTLSQQTVTLTILLKLTNKLQVNNYRKLIVKVSFTVLLNHLKISIPKIKQGTQANQKQSDFDRTCIVLIKCLNKSNTCFVSAQAVLSQFTFVQLKDLIHILGNYNQSIENQSFLCALRNNVIDKISYQSLQQACLVKQFILSFQKYWQIFAFRNLWRNDLKDQKISSFIRAILDKHIQEQCSKQYYFQRICGIYFNNSIEILNIDHTLTIDRYANKHYIYFLPKGRNNNKGGQQIQIKEQNEVNKQLLYPTSIHYHWVESPTPILVSYLPQPLLKKYSDQILQMIMPLNSMVILNKILLHLPKTKISRHVITHCLKYLSKAFDSSCDQQKPVIEILAVQQIFNKLYHMNQADANAEDQDNTIFNVLQRQSDHIIQILRKGLQHRKRLVRQSSRLLLVKYQKLDSFKKY